MTDSFIRTRLEKALPPTWRRMHAAEIDDLLEVFGGRSDWGGPPLDAQAPESLRWTSQLVAFLREEAAGRVSSIETLRKAFEAFKQRYTNAATEDERQRHILWMAERLGADQRRLAGDRRAFARWFDEAALTERYHGRNALEERRLGFVLGRLGVLGAHLLAEAAPHAQATWLWERLALESLLEPLFAYPAEAVRRAAFHCLSTVLRKLPAGEREHAVTDTSLRYIYRVALEPRQDVWVQCEALSLLQELSRASLKTALEHRLNRPGAGEDVFVRRQALRILAEELPGNEALEPLAATLPGDPSPAVRQLIPQVLEQARAPLLTCVLEPLILDDAVAQVRAAALLGTLVLLQRPALFDWVLAVLQRSLCEEDDTFVLRVGLHVVVQGAIRLESHDERRQAWTQALLPVLRDLARGAPKPKVRRWAGEARERLWLMHEPRALGLARHLREALDGVQPGANRRIDRSTLAKVDEHTLGRTLAVLAQEDFALELDDHPRRPRLYRGHRFGWRAWRVLHELLNPSTDKRQAHPHTQGRLFHARLRAPSGILAELAQTKVPGEPLYMDEEGGSRNFLPLVDEVISALEAPFSEHKPVQLYTHAGVTRLRAPATLRARLRAYWSLSTRFAHYAHLRNWREGEASAPDAYVRALEALGFELEFEAHREAGEPVDDATVRRFFPAFLGLPLGEFGELGERIQDYFFSVYENTVLELMLFLGAAFLWFTGRRLYLDRAIRRARNRIPLVIGGWGTRGKSGTERIKAALFNALGYAVVSKTTGCEAMFLHAHPHGRLREMFLFRPYDKATIWEQADVLRLSRNLGCEVFLWECMALTPAYVDVIQRQWMRDDLATITNAYPDHEDLQGPAGFNIPEVMGRFIPKQAVLATTEEQMLPILEAAAQAQDTQLLKAGWLEAGLLAPDILSRFPYEEHPYNIALVVTLARTLGIEEDFALKEMADRVVPDLGVLKASPVAEVKGRRLEFVNGMSANERFGCLGNWERMGFAAHDPFETPGTWLGVVVNNRADRVARSRVFAGILVRDIRVDSIVLIGSNLGGLQTYIREEWAAYAAELSLWPQTGAGAIDPVTRLEQAAREMRVVHAPGHIKARLRAMFEGAGLDDPEALAALWEDPGQLNAALSETGFDAQAVDVLAHLKRWCAELDAYRKLLARLSDVPESGSEALDEAFREHMRQWFMSRFEVIEDVHASGEHIIHRLAALTPAGLLHRIMGLQNIKGTGLDFVYRWQAWEQCAKACDALQSPDAQTAERGLQDLAAFKDYGILCEVRVRVTLDEVRHAAHAQSERFQAELKVIESNLDTALRRLRSQQDSHGAGGWLRRLVDVIEAFLDTGDAVRRRKIAQRVYRDLADERIAHERAALVLRALNERQKGGWLSKRLDAWLARMRPKLREDE